MNGTILLTQNADKTGARVQVDFGTPGVAGFKSIGMEGPMVKDTGTIYTAEELKEMIDRLTDPSGWKKALPGNTVMLGEVPLAVEAVRHYLGGRPTLELSGETVTVTGAGYYAWIGA